MRGREEEEEEEERFVLKAYKSYSKPSWGGMFIRLPARFILCLQHVASMLPYRVTHKFLNSFNSLWKDNELS